MKHWTKTRKTLRKLGWFRRDRTNWGHHHEIWYHEIGLGRCGKTFQAACKTAEIIPSKEELKQSHNRYDPIKYRK